MCKAHLLHFSPSSCYIFYIITLRVLLFTVISNEPLQDFSEGTSLVLSIFHDSNFINRYSGLEVEFRDEKTPCFSRLSENRKPMF